jgi:hypothetical protein
MVNILDYYAFIGKQFAGPEKSMHGPGGEPSGL